MSVDRKGLLGCNYAMTKRVHMASPQEIQGKSHSMPLWPIVFVGALIGATWSGLDPGVMRNNGLETVQVGVAAVKSWADDLMYR